jgi:hypothetical protein
VEAADIPLTRSELIDLGALFPPGAASGERYPEHRLSELGRLARDAGSVSRSGCRCR